MIAPLDLIRLSLPFASSHWLDTLPLWYDTLRGLKLQRISMTEDYHLRYGKGILLVVDTTATTMCSIWIEEILKGYCCTVSLFLVSDIFPFIFMLERMYILISGNFFQ